MKSSYLKSMEFRYTQRQHINVERPQRNDLTLRASLHGFREFLIMGNEPLN